MASNPAKGIELPKVTYKIPKKLSKQDALRLLEIIANYPYGYQFLRVRNHAAFSTFVFAGLRKQERLLARVDWRWQISTGTAGSTWRSPINSLTQFRSFCSRFSTQLPGVAVLKVEKQDVYTVAAEHAMTLVGFAAFLDPPKEGVLSVLEALKQDGISVVVMTGDNP